MAPKNADIKLKFHHKINQATGRDGHQVLIVYRDVRFSKQAYFGAGQ